MMVISALVIALTLVIGSASSISAAPPVKTPSATITITRADVATQTIYYKVEWNNLSRDLAPQVYFVQFITVSFQPLADVDNVTFGGIKTKYSSKELSVIDAGAIPFGSGNVIIGGLWVAAIDGSPVIVVNSVEFTVPS